MRKLKGKAISAKTVKMKVKNHWTVSDFLENYGISEDELMELLRDLFHGDIGEIKRDLKQNEVLKKSAKKKDNTETNEPEAKIEAAEIQGAEAVETQEEKISDKNEKADIEEGAEVKMVQEQEKKLKLLTEEQEKAATLQQNIIALEVNHDELISRKKVIQTQELPKLKAVLEDYKNKILETQVQVISLSDELNEIVGKVSEANETLAQKRAMLQALEEEIQDKKNELFHVREICAEVLPDIITIDFVPHDKELFRLVNRLNATLETDANKIKYPSSTFHSYQLSEEGKHVFKEFDTEEQDRRNAKMFGYEYDKVIERYPLQSVDDIKIMSDQEKQRY